MEKVKEMFLKAFKELTSKNPRFNDQLSEIQKPGLQIKSHTGTRKDAPGFKDSQNVVQLLDSQESKQTALFQALHQGHKIAKGGPLSQTEKLRTSILNDTNASNVFCKKQREELGQRL